MIFFYVFGLVLFMVLWLDSVNRLVIGYYMILKLYVYEGYLDY